MEKSFCGLDDDLHQELMERYENQKNEFELEPTHEESLSYNWK